MLTTLSPWLCLPLAIVLTVCAVFLLVLAPPLWRRDPGQRDDHVNVCRVASAFLAAVGTVLAILAIAYAYAALYGWGVL